MLRIEGVKTTTELHLRILDNDEFNTGQIDTHFMERLLE
jgi:biotin carboxylase